MSGGSGPGGGGKAENAGPSSQGVDDPQGTLGGLAQASAANAAVAEANSIAKAMELGISPAQLAALETQMFDPQNMTAQVTAPAPNGIDFATAPPNTVNNSPKGASIPGTGLSGLQNAQNIEATNYGWGQAIGKMSPEEMANIVGLSLDFPNNYDAKTFSFGPIKATDFFGIQGLLDTVNAATDFANKTTTTPSAELAVKAILGANPVGQAVITGLEGLKNYFGSPSTESGVVDDGVNLHGTNLDADYNAAFGTDYGYNVGPSRSPSFDMGAVSKAGGGEDLQRLIALRRAMAQEAAKKIINVSNDVGLTPEDIQNILPPSTSTPPSGGGTPPSGGGTNSPKKPKRPPKRGRDGSANNPPKRVETAAERLVRVVTAPKISRSISRPVLKEAIKTGNIVGSDNQVDLIRAILNPPKTLTRAQQINQSGRGGGGK